MSHVSCRALGQPGHPWKSFAALEASDVRAFMAMRRADDIGGRSLMQMVAGLRSFGQFSGREGQGQGRLAESDPCAQGCKDTTEADPDGSRQTLPFADAESGRDERDPWIAARNAAVLTLLYGSGLRISEALGLTSRRAAPQRGRRAHRHRQGQQDPHGAGAAACCSVAEYAALAPIPSAAGPLFVGARGGPLNPAHRPARDGEARGALGLPDTATPHALRHSFATHLLGPAATCARSRNCSAMPRCRPRRSTRASTASGCWKSIRAAHRGLGAAPSHH